jgi:uncharacterized protein YndB with AHSA1/START domain
MTTTTALELEIPPGEPVIRFRRFVTAPPELVWEAYTRCEHLRNWWGPRALEMVECAVDLRPGGAWRHVVRAPDGSVHGFGGEYVTVERPHTLACTFVYDGAPDQSALDTVTFEAVDGGTLIHGHSQHDSVEARDAHVASGMEAGMRESYDRLGELLDTLRAG